jgi:hypothetical protein
LSDLSSLSEWASRQERTGILRIWSPAPRTHAAEGAWYFEERDVRIDPFFLVSVLFHLLLALLLWRAIAAMPEIEPPKKEEVIVKLEDFLPKQYAGSPAAAPRRSPSSKARRAAPSRRSRRPGPSPAATTRRWSCEAVPKPEPEPVLVPRRS